MLIAAADAADAIIYAFAAAHTPLFTDTHAWRC